LHNAQAQDTKEIENYDQGFKLGFGVSGGYATGPIQISLGSRCKIYFNKKDTSNFDYWILNLFVSKRRK
jgi:plastocyanin domain-containing protein